MDPAPYFCHLETPIGHLTIEAIEEGITAIRWPDYSGSNIFRTSKLNQHLNQAIEQITAYFDHKLDTFNLCLAPVGTQFQLRVWRALQQIEFGTTVSYQYIAETIGNPNACRAVGSANGKNPIPIIIPCHRIISSDGTLGGFAAGLETKRWLLEHEKR
ncbi:MAG TPA: cysteine methyltransferase [Gammaproteobacteria bacterium]|nr:cysteine methyltransferase [Gammaproteobacteria bacterium]